MLAAGNFRVPFFLNPLTLAEMKAVMFAIIAACFVLPAAAQPKRPERKSLLDSDPSVVYLGQTLTQPIKLKVIKDAPVFSDKEGKHRLGTLKADQTVLLEAMTDKIYRVRGEGTRHGIAGWIAPWAFSSTDPNFAASFKELYERQIQVQELIATKSVAIGMTIDEVALSRGKATKTSLRKTAEGQSGTWEYIDYEDVKNYVTEVDRTTGAIYRRLASVTREERGKTAVEFVNEVVTAIEESENRQGTNVRIIVPPLTFRW